jgi:D-arabinose 1-dehydrogenase-like Zn-dependent alcohol dehydrogenase
VDGTRWAIDSLGAKGRLIALTTFRDRPVPIESRELVFREVSVIGSRYATKSEVAQAAGLVASGAVQPVIGAVVGPAEILDLHARLAEGSLLGRGALQWGGRDD